MEYFDELTEAGEKTGRKIERTVAHKTGILHGTSQIYVYRIKIGKLEILLQRRSGDKDSYPGCLDISCAGHVPSGENYDSNARKELSEELGLKVELSELEFFKVFRTEKHAVFYGKQFNDNQLSAVYIMKLDREASEFRFQKEEISELIWMTADEIEHRLKNGDSEFCMNYERFCAVMEFIKKKR